MTAPGTRGGEALRRLAALTRRVPLRRVGPVGRPIAASYEDWVAVERPLVIEAALQGSGETARATVSTTMRTPGDDVDLALGFLWAEGVVRDVAEVDLGAIVFTSTDDREGQGAPDTITVPLGEEAATRLGRAARHNVTTSACGVCGRDDLSDLLPEKPAPAARPAQLLDASLLCALPARLRLAQHAFARTGGLHAAGLFDSNGEVVVVREDVGRHNALDKVLGDRLRAGHHHLEESVLVVSGRASYELVQKAAVARIPVMLAVGAPSSLAIRVAEAADMTLLGFVRAEGFNVYHQGTNVRWRE